MLHLHTGAPLVVAKDVDHLCRDERTRFPHQLDVVAGWPMMLTAVAARRRGLIRLCTQKKRPLPN
jgi:hypothetical protein